MAVQTSTEIHPIAALAEGLRGEVIAPDHPDYERARRVWNGMIDKRPALIARCADADDVATAVRFAAETGMALAVRGGGHNVAGTAVVDDGIVIDLSPMREVRIDASGRTVHVQGGATWADVDRVTAPLGLATPGGVVSETGVAGLALSGGVSWQRRRDGMTVDNLVSAEVVLADGRRVRASADEHPDLHWAIRGGGGNFGVVTSFELALHELGPDVYHHFVAYPIEDAARVLAGWRDAVAGAPDELSTVGFIWSLPGGPRAARAPARPALCGRVRHVGGRPGRRGARHPAPAGARDAAARPEHDQALPRAAAGARRLLPRRPALLLEGALPRRAPRRPRSTRRSIGRPVARRSARSWSSATAAARSRASGPRRPPSATAARSGC